jgi:peroxiredoxin Q/BCP
MDGAACTCASTQRPDGGSGLLPVGSSAPKLSGKDQDGATVQLQQENRGALLVYFYPKDATPGCTKEACAFRDTWAKFQNAGVQVLGVSNDSVASHEEFATEQKLPFKLIADEDGVWAKAFGVGSTAGFYSRVSFLIDKNGRVARVYEDVDPIVHAQEVLEHAGKL